MFRTLSSKTLFVGVVSIISVFLICLFLTFITYRTLLKIKVENISIVTSEIRTKLNSNHALIKQMLIRPLIFQRHGYGPSPFNLNKNYFDKNSFGEAFRMYRNHSNGDLITDDFIKVKLLQTTDNTGEAQQFILFSFSDNDLLAKQDWNYANSYDHLRLVYTDTEGMQRQILLVMDGIKDRRKTDTKEIALLTALYWHSPSEGPKRADEIMTLDRGIAGTIVELANHQYAGVVRITSSSISPRIKADSNVGFEWVDIDMIDDKAVLVKTVSTFPTIGSDQSLKPHIIETTLLDLIDVLPQAVHRLRLVQDEVNVIDSIVNEKIEQQLVTEVTSNMLFSFFDGMLDPLFDEIEFREFDSAGETTTFVVTENILLDDGEEALHITSEYPLSLIRYEWFNYYGMVLILILALLLIIFLLNVGQALSTARRIRDLSIEAAQQAQSRGFEFNTKEVKKEDEIGELARKFKSMVNSLRHSHIAMHGRYSSQVILRTVLGHEIRSPLQTLKARIPSDDTVSTGLVNRIAYAIQNITMAESLSELFENAETYELPINNFMQEIVLYVQERTHVDNVNYSSRNVPEDLKVLANQEILEDALDELIRNAASFRTPATAIEVMTRVDNDTVIISVFNVGPAVPPELISNLFAYGLTTRAGDSEIHKGIGLFKVKAAVTSMGGSVRVSNMNDGVIFELTLNIVT